jgi:primary-amine oxidase
MKTGYDGRGRTLDAAAQAAGDQRARGQELHHHRQHLHWRNWEMHFKLDSRVGLMFSTVTYNDHGKKRQIMYEGSLGGMIVPYGDPDVGWYFKAYLDSGEYGMGTLTSSIERGKDTRKRRAAGRHHRRQQRQAT